MNRLCRTWLAPLTVFLLSAPGKAFAAGGGGAAIVFVADTRSYSGWQAWWSNLYNENLFYFTVLTIIFIPTLGVILGLLTDFFMARIGIDLKSRAISEH